MKTAFREKALIFLLTLGIVINVSLSQMTMNHFEEHIEQRCYDQLDGEELLYGQKYPLAQTLENFLNLVEKYELANPDKSLTDVTAMLLKNFTYSNLVKEENDFVDGNVPAAKTANIRDYWEKKLPTGEIKDENNPFDDDEICSLFFTLTHSVNDTAWPFENSYAAQFPGPDGTMKSVSKVDRPREQGVVSIKMSSRSVALGRVISGIYLASSGDTLDRMEDIIKIDIPDTVKGGSLDPFYLLTIGDFLALASWNQKDLGGNGVWYSAQNTKINSQFIAEGICPNVYRLPEERDTAIAKTSQYTYSSLRGAIDGIILGNILLQNTDFRNVKLSQLLRMYYSGRGIRVMYPKEETVSFCRRSELIPQHKDKIIKEAENAVYILSGSFQKNKIEPRLVGVRNIYDTQVTNNDVIDVKEKSEQFETCDTDYSSLSIENLPCDTPSDVIAVLDTRNNGESLQKQQIILGHLANNLKLWHQGSKLTVLLDRRNDSSTLGLEQLLFNSTSSPCAACYLIHREIDQSTNQDVSKDFVIQSIDKFLQDKKDEERDLDGAAGKIVIYFDFDTAEKKSYRLDKVLKDFFLSHLDVTIFAIGNEKEVLSKYARNNVENSLLASIDSKELVAELTKKICQRPASLQYGDCKWAKNERSAVYYGLITPNSKQYWAMDPEYFEKSYTSSIIIDLEDTNGDIDVYHNRANMPETSEKNHRQLNSTKRQLVYDTSNPCKGFNKIACSPMMFSFVGRERRNINGGNEISKLCEDKEGSNCKRLDQIRFKITHDGIRCSSCSGLSSTFMIMIVSIIISFIMS